MNYRSSYSNNSSRYSLYLDSSSSSAATSISVIGIEDCERKAKTFMFTLLLKSLNNFVFLKINHKVADNNLTTYYSPRGWSDYFIQVIATAYVPVKFHKQQHL